MAGRRPSGHALSKASAAKARRGRGRGHERERARPALRDESTDDDDDEGDEHTKKKKKKKKKKKSSGEAEPSKLRLLQPKEWEGVRLAPIVREVVSVETEVSAAEIDATRRRLGLRVPTVKRKPCTFWLKGECKRGDACAFLHATAEQAAAMCSSTANVCPPPVLSLGDPKLPRLIGRAMLRLGYRSPSAIQAQTWPAALAGCDVLCRAPTGSGKTLGYLLPALAHVQAQPKPPRPGAGPRVLVLVPTRELAVQTLSVARSLRKVAGGINAAAVYGGGPREEQLADMESAIGVLVATTGRLLDLIEARNISLTPTTMLVLDEADSLVALGFAAQVGSIVGQIRPDRQTLLFSATFAPTLEEAAASWLRHPVRIYAEGENGSNHVSADQDSNPLATQERGDAGLAAGGDGDAVLVEDVASTGLSAVPETVTEHFIVCENGQRRQALLETLTALGVCSARTVGGAAGDDGARANAMASLADMRVSADNPRRQPPRALVFVSEIKGIKALASSLRKSSLRCGVLHGALDQSEREEALRDFRSGKLRILLATDVAARGVDVQRLEVVVSFDPPPSPAQYVHRVGRTGRQGASGTAVTLLRLGAEGRTFARGLVPMMRAAGKPVPQVLAELAGNAHGDGLAVTKSTPERRPRSGAEEESADDGPPRKKRPVADAGHGSGHAVAGMSKSLTSGSALACGSLADFAAAFGS